MGNGAWRKCAHWVQVDRWSWGGWCVHYSRDCGGRSRGQWDLDSSWHIDGAGNTEALLLVRLKHVGEAKSLATHITWVGLLPCVSSAMSLHVWAAGEALPTNFTDKGLLSCQTQIQPSVRHRISANTYFSVLTHTNCILQKLLWLLPSANRDSCFTEVLSLYEILSHLWILMHETIFDKALGKGFLLTKITRK